MHFIQFSSIFGRETYFGYAVDWILETLSIGSCFVCFTTVGSLYCGLCLYINGMAMDIKTRLIHSANGTEGKVVDWPTYAQNIDFHNDMIEYDIFLCFAI